MSRWFPDRVTPGPRLKRGLWVFHVLCVLLFALDFLHLRHAETDFDWLWGFYALYGFVACVVLVLVAKWMRTFLMRGEDYYEGEHGDE